jgi:hypothetical protein
LGIDDGHTPDSYAVAKLPHTMTYTVVALIKRKQGITPAQFREHYDSIHVPLLKALVGSAFPLTHIRNYVAQTSAGSNSLPEINSCAEDFSPVLIFGDPSAVNYDSITMMTWEDKAAFDRFNHAFNQPEVLEKMAEDDEHYRDSNFNLAYVIDGSVTTGR